MVLCTNIPNILWRRSQIPAFFITYPHLSPQKSPSIKLRETNKLPSTLRPAKFLEYLMLKHLILGHLILRHLTLGHLILEHLILGHLILKHLIIAHLILEYLIMGHLILQQNHDPKKSLLCASCFSCKFWMSVITKITWEDREK